MISKRDVLIVITLGAVAVMGCSSAGTARGRSLGTDAPVRTAETIAGETQGGRVFRTQCAACHGAKGEGNLGPGLVGIANRLGLQDELLVVRHGKGRMPSFQPALTDAEIRAVIDYTRTRLG